MLGIRPSSFEDATLVHEQGWPTLKADIDVTEELGSEMLVLFSLPAPPVQHDIMIAKFDKAAVEDATAAPATLSEGHSPWTARVNPRSRAKPGRSIELAIDTRGLHFFDADSGRAIGHPASGTGTASI